MNQLGPFEQNLLAELRQAVTEQAERPVRRPVRRGRIALATAGGGLLAAGVVVGLPAMDEATTPAYAVVSNDDGTVTVRVERYENADGLEGELAEHGVVAVIDYVPPGSTCAKPRFEYGDSTGTPAALFVAVEPAGDPGGGAVEMMVDPAALRGRTLVIEHNLHQETVPEGVATTPLSMIAAVGPVAPCELVEIGE